MTTLLSANNKIIGLGNANAAIKVYIENRPPLPFYQELTHCYALQSGDIANIAEQTGNHWRKIFNVFAKLEFERSPQQFTSWQQLRDETLLQVKSQQCLVFSSPTAPLIANDKASIHILMGKTYATKQGLATQCYWLNEYFAINEQQRLIICPYFDYRQLSNIKITQLVKLITSLS